MKALATNLRMQILAVLIFGAVFRVGHWIVNDPHVFAVWRGLTANRSAAVSGQYNPIAGEILANKQVGAVSIPAAARAEVEDRDADAATDPLTGPEIEVVEDRVAGSSRRP